MIDLLARRREMMGASGDNIVYQASNIDFDGATYLNTGIPLMDGRDFEMHINFTPSALSTSYKYFACRGLENGGYCGFDFRYSISEWDIVGNNSDNRYDYVVPQVGTPVDITIKRISGTMTADVEGYSKIINANTYTLGNLCIGSDSLGSTNSKAKMYLNEIIIKAL